ncbi:MAG: hypothetical protein ACO271_08800, partial [Burkholderiales bacterium]
VDDGGLPLAHCDSPGRFRTVRLHDARLGFFQVLPIVLFVSAPIQANQIRYFILQKLIPSCLSFFSS